MPKQWTNKYITEHIWLLMPVSKFWNNFISIFPEVTRMIIPLSNNLIIHHIHSQSQILILRQSSQIDKLIKHVLHIVHKILHAINLAKNGSHIRSPVSQMSQIWSPFALGDIWIDFGYEVVWCQIGHLLQWTHSPDVRDHGCELGEVVLVVWVVVEFQCCWWQRDVKWTQSGFHVGGEFVAGVPVGQGRAV